FAPHLAEFAGLLPAAPVQVSAHGPDGAVWFGGTVDLVIEVTGLPMKTAAVRRTGADPGCLRLDTVIEESHAERGVEAHRLTLRHTATAPCRGEIALAVDLDGRSVA